MTEILKKKNEKPINGLQLQEKTNRNCANRTTLKAEFFSCPFGPKASPFDYTPAILPISGKCKTKKLENGEKKK